MKRRTTPRDVEALVNPWVKGRVSDMPNGKSMRVRDIISDYLKSHKYESLSLGTKMRYQYSLRILDLLILADNKSIYHRYVHKVDYTTVDYLHKVFAHTHSPATIKFYFAILSNVWQYAMRNGKAVWNPWLKNEVRIKNERDIVWTPAQIEIAIKTAIENKMHVLALYILLAYETGVRVWSDLRPLKWENVKVHDDGNTVLDFVISKTGVRLVLPLSDRARDCLARVTRHSDFVFSSANGRLLTKSGIWTQLQKIKAIAKLPNNLQFRDIRRSVNTELAEAGATREELRSVNGWKSDRHIPRYALIRYGTALNGMEKRWEKLRLQDSE